MKKREVHDDESMCRPSSVLVSELDLHLPPVRARNGDDQDLPAHVEVLPDTFVANAEGDGVAVHRVHTSEVLEDDGGFELRRDRVRITIRHILLPLPIRSRLRRVIRARVQRDLCSFAGRRGRGDEGEHVRDKPRGVVGIEEVLDDREGLGVGYAEVDDGELLVALGRGQLHTLLGIDRKGREVGALRGEDDVVDGVHGDLLGFVFGADVAGVVDGEHV